MNTQYLTPDDWSEFRELFPAAAEHLGFLALLAEAAYLEGVIRSPRQEARFRNVKSLLADQEFVTA